MEEQAYAYMMAPCCLCNQAFSFNPHKVPSLMVQGRREPVCLPCHTSGNAQRKAAGVPIWPEPLPGAYEAFPAEEL